MIKSKTTFGYIEANQMVLARNLSHVSQTYFFFYSWIYPTSQGLVGFFFSSLQLQARKVNVEVNLDATQLPLVGLDSADTLVAIHQVNCCEQEITSKETIAFGYSLMQVLVGFLRTKNKK